MHPHFVVDKTTIDGLWKDSGRFDWQKGAMHPLYNPTLLHPRDSDPVYRTLSNFTGKLDSAHLYEEARWSKLLQTCRIEAKGENDCPFNVKENGKMGFKPGTKSGL